MTFNVAASLGGDGNTCGDSVISYDGGGDTLYGYGNIGAFPAGGPASTNFATLMDEGGVFQFGGDGSGTVTISGLTVGSNYLVQVFNYAPGTGDPVLTTESGSPAVTLSGATGSGGSSTYGEFATGTFTANATTETFDWNGAGSTYTVLGEISVRQLPPPMPPAVPTGLTAVAGDSQVSLTWNGSSGAASYNVKRSTSSGGEVTITNVASMSFTNTGLANGTKYYYVISATNSYGESTNSSEVSATPAISPTSPVYDIVFVGDSTTYGLTLVNPATQAPPVQCMQSLNQRYNVMVYESNQGFSGHTTVDWLPTTNPSSDFQQAISAAATLEANTPGQLIFSIMLGGNDSAEYGPNGAPVSPTNYLQNLQSIVGQFLAYYPAALVFVHYPSWYSPNTESGWDYLSGGLVRLQTYFPEIDQLIADCATNYPGHVFEGETLAFNYFTTNYRYLVDMNPQYGPFGTYYLHPDLAGAIDLGQFWANAIAASLNFSPLFTNPPAPTGLTATAVNGLVNLSWNASSGATGYNVGRSTTSGGSYTSIGNTTNFYYTDTSPVSGATYYYAVSATNSSSASTNSSPVSVTAFVITNGTYIFTDSAGYAMDDPNGGGAGTGLDQKTYSGADQQWIITSAGNGQFAITSAVNGLAVTAANIESPLVLEPYTGAANQLWYFSQNTVSNYYIGNVQNGENIDENSGGGSGVAVYSWDATNDDINQQWTLTFLAPLTLSVPAAPIGLNTAASDAQASLSWGSSLGATSYNVKRSTISGGEVTITNVNRTSYTDTGLTNGTTYYYVVSAVNGNGQSANSSQVSATPAPVIVGVLWGAATGITGDANLSTNGTYVDALIPNTGATNLTGDGVVFHVAAYQGNDDYGDGVITLSGSGLINYSYPGSFPVGGGASTNFSMLMDDGGVFQNGGSGSGTVTISGLTVGDRYQVQIFNYAPGTGDPGLTTLSGSPAVTLSIATGSGGPSTYGEFATGTFAANASTETFDWNGAGSTYTVLGEISVRQLPTAKVAMTGTTTTNSSATTTLSGIFAVYTGTGEGGSGVVVTDTNNSANFSFLSPISPSTIIVAHHASDLYAYSGDFVGTSTSASSAGEKYEETGYSTAGGIESEYSSFSLNTVFFTNNETFKFYMETYDTATTITFGSVDLGSDYASYTDTLGTSNTLVDDYVTLTLTGLTIGDTATFSFTTGAHSSGTYPTEGLYGATVSAAPTNLTAALVNGQFTLQFNGTDGQSYTVEMSTNLADGDWTPVFTNIPSEGVFIYTDANMTDAARFYRVRQ